jgi:uncharacterized protein YjiS (DUF1127 family)
MSFAHAYHEKGPFAKLQANDYINVQRQLECMRSTHMSTLQLRSSFATLAGTGHRAASAGQVGSARELLRGAGETLFTWLDRAQQRRHLRTISDHMLRDIGLSRADVESEAGKPFWRP